MTEQEKQLLLNDLCGVGKEVGMTRKEPRFKAGDWICSDDAVSVGRIESIDKDNIYYSIVYYAPSFSFRSTNREFVDKYYHHFENAALDFADKFIIDKAVAWLKQNANRYIYNAGTGDDFAPKIAGSMYEDFRKAMEG